MIPNVFKTSLSKTYGEENLAQGNFMVFKREKIGRHVLYLSFDKCYFDNL